MAKTPAERAKDYRDRKRANKPPKQPAKTNRERCHEYRARQKKIRANSSGVFNNISEIGEIRENLRVMPPPRSSQQRSRDCQQLNTDLRIDVQPSTSRFDDAHFTLDTSVSIDLPYADFNAHRDDEEEDSNEPDLEESLEMVNKLFTKEGGFGRCSLCRARIPLRLSSLKAHLKESHPNENPIEEEYDTDDANANTYQEVVYLYDSDSKSTPADVKPSKSIETPKRSGRQNDRARTRPAVSKRRRSSVIVEDSGLSTADEEIDKFGKYVTCLLKSVPKEVCSQLQMDIVSLIMTAKIKHMSKPVSTHCPSAPTANLTINDVPADSSISQTHAASIILTIPNDGQEIPTSNGIVNNVQTTSSISSHAPSIIVTMANNAGPAGS